MAILTTKTTSDSNNPADINALSERSIRGPSIFIGGELTTGENQVFFIVPDDFTISVVKVACLTSSTGDSILVDVNYHATDPQAMVSIFTDQNKRPEIAPGSKSDTSPTPDITAIAAGGYIGISIDNIGSTIAGEDLAVTLVAV